MYAFSQVSIYLFTSHRRFAKMRGMEAIRKDAMEHGWSYQNSGYNKRTNMH